MKALQFNVTPPRFAAAKALGAVLGNQAFYRGPLKTVRIAEIPEPTLPTPDWVKIKTLYCGFCGSDLNLILLHDSPTATPFTSLPCVTGHEIVGRIIETGTGVAGFSVDDLVTVNPGLTCESRGITPLCPSCRDGRASCENFAKGNLPPGMFIGITNGVNGGFAPYLAAHKSQLFKLPEGLALEAGVMTEPVAVALQSVFDNLPQKNDNILVIGGGVIGNLIIQSIRALAPGCHVSVMEPSAFAADLARTAGADAVVSAKDPLAHVACITGATPYKPIIGKEIFMGGFHRIFDTVASTGTLKLAMRLLAGMGTLSVVGIGGDVKLDLTPLWLKLQTIKGVYGYGRQTFNGRDRHVFDIALELMMKGKIRVKHLVTHRFRLEDYEEMIAVNLKKGKHRAMKTVMAFE